MDIQKVAILEIKEGGKYAKIQGRQGQVFDNVPLYHSYGDVCNIGSTDSSLGLMVQAGSNTQAFIFPYDMQSQPTDLKPNERKTGNFRDNLAITYKIDEIIISAGDTTKITLKKDNDIKIEAGTTTTFTITKDANILVKAPLITLDGNVNITGTLGVTGAVIMQSALTVLGAFASLTAVIGGQSFTTHIHSGVATGPGVTGPVV